MAHGNEEMTGMTTVQMKERVLSQGNRHWWMGFAILWVMLFHMWCMDGGLKNYVHVDFFDFFFSKGYLGVDFFFFFSAYGCACSLSKNSLKKFYRNRFFRIFPIYFIYTLVLVLIVSKYYQQPWWLMFLKQVSGISTLTSSHLHIEWYMPAQILVYVFFPVVYRFAKVLRGNSVLFFFVILFFSLFVFVIDRVFISEFAYRIPIIIIGTVTFFLLKDNERDHHLLLKYYVLGAIIAFLMIDDVLLFCSLTLPLILYAFSESHLALPCKRFFSFIGKHSLEIYLAQNFALDHFMGKMSSDGQAIKFLECAVIIIIGSFLLWYIQHLTSKLIKH